MGEVSSLAGYDLAFIGLPIQAYGPGEDVKSFLGQHSKGKNVALFITHASPEDQPEVKEWLDKCKAAAAGAKIVGVFHCQGELSQAIADFMSNSGDPKLAEAAKERPLTVGQPDAARLKKARNFAVDIMKKHSRG
jgi:hypothetical protein